MVESKLSVRHFFRITLGLALLGVVLLCVSGPDAQGKERKQSLRKLSLHQAISNALKRNLSLADAKLQVQKKEHARRAAYSDFFPTIELEYEAVADRYRQIGNIEEFYLQHDARWQFRGGTFLDYPYRIDPYRTFALSATLTQPVYSGGKLTAQYELARLGVDLAKIKQEIARQDLLINVTQAYFQLLLAEKLLYVSDESIRALKGLRRQSEAMFDAHLVLRVDVLAINTRLAQEELQRSQALQDIENKRALLSYLMRYPQGIPFETTERLAFEPTGYEIPGIYSIVARNRLEIGAADISVREALATVKVDQASLLPEMYVEVSGSRTNDDWNPFDPEANNDWSMTGVLTWTFDMFRTRETVKEARVSHRREMVLKRQVVELVMREVKQAYATVKRYERDVLHSRRAAAFSRENFRANKELYNGQMATYLEIVTAQAQMTETLREYYRSLVAHRMSKAVLERKMGILR